MYIHYILGLVCIVLGILHALIMHYDYKDNNLFDGSEKEVEWFDLVFKNELFKLTEYLLFLYFLTSFLYEHIEPVNYEIFM